MVHPEVTRASLLAHPAGLRSRKLILAAVIGELLCVSPGALAQVAPTPKVPVPAKAEQVKAKPAEQPAAAGTSGEQVATVNVVGERPTNRIDRQVYDVKSDASSTNGTAADALNNVPSVAVDPDGTVSLRGNTNVQILIDGKPSAMLQGDNRGNVLQAMPSEDIDSVEVINNPGAEFGNEAGGGPILNLVMKRVRKAGGFGVVNANYGSAGRYNTALNGSYNTGRFGFQGGVNFRHDGRNSVGEDDRERIDPATGVSTRSQTMSTSAGLNDSAGVNGGMHYNVGDKDTLSAQVGYLGRNNGSNGADHYLTYMPDSDTVASDYLRTNRRSGSNRNYQASTTWDHKGEIRGETFKLDLRVSGNRNSSDNNYANTYAVLPPFARDSRSMQGNDSDTRITDFTGDYERPIEGGGLFKAGFKVMDTRTDADTLFVDIDPVTGDEIVNLLRTNDFQLDQGNVALYGSYQMRLTEKWGVLGGLRAEYTHIDINQLTQQVEATNHYVNYIPSAFATYKLSDDTNLRFSYAHRLRRANAGELNPFIVYRDEFNESQGNPKLNPMQTDSFEAGLETHVGKLEANLRGYYRKDKDAILWRSTFVRDNVLLSRPENLGGSRASGLEFTMSGRVAPRLSINASGNLARSEQRQFDTSGADIRRTASSLSGRVRVNYSLTEGDQVQVMVHGQGKTLTGQGYRQPSHSVNLTLRHNITPALAAVLNVTDILNSQKTETITDTATLREDNLRRYDGRIMYFGLSYRFGGAGGGKREGRGGGRFGGGGPGGPGGAGGFGGGPGS